MTIAEPSRQIEFTNQLRDQAHTLAASTREVPHRGDTYQLLGDLRDTISGMKQVVSHLGAFHADARDGIDYDGEDGTGSGQSAREAADSLNQATAALAAVGKALNQAHAANSHIRWK